jgi:4-hydroxy-3-methylbut-2-enyl diphosphate reductase
MSKFEKADNTGFCFGVKRAINTLEEVARKRGGVETLGAVVHNQQVLMKLSEIGVRVVKNIEDIEGNVIVTSSHGVSPEVEERLKERHIEIISTTCPFVRRAQVAARRLAEAGFFVVVYGDAQHPEVTGILGWAKGKGMATVDAEMVKALQVMPRRLGVLSQTTQIPSYYSEFVRNVIGSALTKDSEIRIIDTICHDIRERQSAALELAQKADLMLVVGGRFSANTNLLARLCSPFAETHLIETAGEIQKDWLKGKHLTGVTAGASTAEETVQEVIKRLEEI